MNRSCRNVAWMLAALLAIAPVGWSAGTEMETAADSPSRGSTGPLPETVPLSDTTDDTSRTMVWPLGAFLPLPPSALGTRFTSDPAWDLLQESTVFTRLKTADAYAVRFDNVSQALVPAPPVDPLTVKARQAVDRAPTWLKKELEDQFSRMSSTTQQDKWADEVLNAVDPHVDETAFLVAHMSKDDLQKAAFFPRVLRESAHYAYEVDPFLDYVEVVDYGSASEGGDYYTTLRYQVELDGVVTAVEYPKEIYYWWVLSPRGSDEFPTFIDADAACSSSGTPQAPPSGVFWRDWYFYGATNRYGGLCDTDWDGAHDDPCPVLKDSLAGVTVLWRHLGNTNGPENGAVGVVNDWIRKSIGPFGDVDGCRPVQPVTIYYWTDGNCGEWADVTFAAGRAALIPTEETGTAVNDHVWNEFYDEQWGRWVQWEPVNNMIDSNYSGWWGGKIAATHTYRGDGYGHSERTSQHGPSATITVTVYDANHYPVDGAKVSLSSEYDPIPGLLMKATQGHTDAAGQITFTVGDSRNYYVSVTTPWGSYPASGSALVVSNAVGGTAYTWSPPNFSGSVPRLSVTPASSPGTNDDNLLEVSFDVTEGLVHGESFVSSSLTYAKDHPGNVDFFVADAANYGLFTSGSAFQAYELAIDGAGTISAFVPPTAGDYYVTWSNRAAMDMAEVVSGTVRLYRNNGSVPPVSQLAVGKDGAGASLLDWEDVVGQNVDGYNVYRSTSAADVGSARGQEELQPFLLGTVAVSSYADAATAPPGTCFFYSVRTHSSKGGISP